MRPATAAFVTFIALLFGLGLLVGHEVSTLPKLEPFKLLNILGLSLDLLGLLVLSEFVASSERVKEFVVKWVAGVVIWGITVVSIGALAGAALSSGQSSSKAASFFFKLFAYATLPLGALDYTVFNPFSPLSQDRSQRTRRFGLLLLASGAVVQLIAAFQDLYA